MSEKRQRQAAVGFRVTPAEERAITTAARALGVSVSAFARRAVMLAAGEEAESLNVEQRLLRDVVAEVQRVGLITKKRVVQPADADRIVAELRRLQFFILQQRNGQMLS